ncbi:MAG: hypothetical protein Fur0011_5180 [Candidatus Microgenomates bacterium]
MKFSLRLLYLYLFSFVGLLITIIGSIQLIDLGLKTYVLKVSDYTYYPEPLKIEGIESPSVEEMKRRNEEEASNQRKRQISNSLAMIIVGVPVYLYHWKTIKKESKS